MRPFRPTRLSFTAQIAPLNLSYSTRVPRRHQSDARDVFHSTLDHSKLTLYDKPPAPERDVEQEPEIRRKEAGASQGILKRDQDGQKSQPFGRNSNGDGKNRGSRAEAYPTPKRTPLDLEVFAQARDRKTKTEQALWFSHPSSPGSPIFTPDGTYVLLKLQAFLRAQYAEYGFQEVITPLMYKKSLWEQSGHWENYKNDMYSVHSGKQPTAEEGQEHQVVEHDTFGLKPMNCPGHCVLFGRQRWSYNDLPIRYADFSPLHRDEISGALSGLTRVRRFHQDDGHIFCRPSQIKDEITACLQLTDSVYKTLGIRDYELVLSTRPKTDYIGTPDEWSQAESQLKDALEASDKHWNFQEGEGAFYGPKIDFLISDAAGKQHQISTIQLDFQLPKRFELNYNAPPDEHANGGIVAEPSVDGIYFRPVMIHRAIFGSLERFLALLIDKHQGRWPFWLNPNPLSILTVTDNEAVEKMAKDAVQKFRYPFQKAEASSSNSIPSLRQSAQHVKVHLDNSNETLNKKIALEKGKGTGIIAVVGKKNLEETTLDIQVSAVSNPERVWRAVERAKAGSQEANKKGTRTGMATPGDPSARLNVCQLQRVLQILTDEYI